MKERWIAVIAAEEQELAGMDEFMEDRRTETGAAGCVYRMGRGWRRCAAASAR